MPMTKSQRQRRYLDKLYAKARRADALEPLARELLTWAPPVRMDPIEPHTVRLANLQGRIRQVLEAEQ